MALFFSLSDEDGPSPYLVSRSLMQCNVFTIHTQGHIDLSSISRKGYHVPRKGTIQVVSVRYGSVYNDEHSTDVWVLL